MPCTATAKKASIFFYTNKEINNHSILNEFSYCAG